MAYIIYTYLTLLTSSLSALEMLEKYKYAYLWLKLFPNNPYQTSSNRQVMCMLLHFMLLMYYYSYTGCVSLQCNTDMVIATDHSVYLAYTGKLVIPRSAKGQSSSLLVLFLPLGCS